MQKHIQLDTRVQNLEYAEPWKCLTDRERNYAYFMSMASWAGAKMVLHQIAYESPALFLIFQAYFQGRDFHKLEAAAAAQGVSSADWKNFIAYVGGFYGNMGNYHSFGAMKFIPDLSEDAFCKILRSNPLYSNGNAFYKEVIDELLPQVKKEVFAIEKPYTQLNFPEEGGVTGYFSRDMIKEDLVIIKLFLAEHKIDVLNTRAFKEDGKYVITVGSISKEGSKSDVEFKGYTFDIRYGEFAPYLEECNAYLTEALKYCANETQE